ncbi:hypothetical protein D3C76_1490040 [compost metagenome]
MHRAHIPVNKIFQLHTTPLTKQLSCLQIHFPRGNYTSYTQITQRIDHLQVVNIHHYGRVNRKVKLHLPNKLQHCHILNNQGIWPSTIKETQVFSSFLHIFLTKKIIHSDIHFFV